MNILIVEDDQLLAKNIIREFKLHSPVNIIKHLSSYGDFLHESNYQLYDIILLDIFLHKNFKIKENGFTILKHIRSKNKSIPIIIMSNMVQYDYLEEAFYLGAQDYLIKPFRIRELQIRIKRWYNAYVFTEFYSYRESLEYHELSYIPASNEFYYENSKVILTKSDKLLFSLLLINRGCLLSQTYLSEKIWGENMEGNGKNLRIKILRLKKSLKPHDLDTRIQTVHGEGYILEKS